MLLSQYVEEMDLTDLYSTYERIRENQVTPRQLLKILLYGYMNREYSSRAIETRCKRDINFMYLLEDNPAPDHSTIVRYNTNICIIKKHPFPSALIHSLSFLLIKLLCFLSKVHIL